MPLGGFLFRWVFVRGFDGCLLVSPEIRCVSDSAAGNDRRLFGPFHRKPGVCPREHAPSNRVRDTHENHCSRHSGRRVLPLETRDRFHSRAVWLNESFKAIHRRTEFTGNTVCLLAVGSGSPICSSNDLGIARVRSNHGVHWKSILTVIDLPHIDSRQISGEEHALVHRKPGVCQPRDDTAVFRLSAQSSIARDRFYVHDDFTGNPVCGISPRYV